jgi:lipopolysaccharide transport system permease protein
LEVKPATGWAIPPLGELWRYRDLVILFVRRDFVAHYKQTILGPAWFVLQPLLQTLVFTFVFGSLAGFSTEGLPKPLFYLSGTILWGYFATSLTQCSEAFVTHAGLFGKVYFPRLAVPVSIVISQAMRLALQIVFLLVVIGIFAGRGFVWTPRPMVAVVLPLLILAMASLAMGFGLLFSALTARYRDLRFLLQFGVQLAMYVTPVIYPLSAAEGKLRWIMLLNPMTPVIEAFRHVTYGAGHLSWPQLAATFAAAVLTLVIGLLVFSRVERTFTDTL